MILMIFVELVLISIGESLQIIVFLLQVSLVAFFLDNSSPQKKLATLPIRHR